MTDKERDLTVEHQDETETDRVDADVPGGVQRIEVDPDSVRPAPVQDEDGNPLDDDDLDDYGEQRPVDGD